MSPDHPNRSLRSSSVTETSMIDLFAVAAAVLVEPQAQGLAPVQAQAQDVAAVAVSLRPDGAYLANAGPLPVEEVATRLPANAAVTLDLAPELDAAREHRARGADRAGPARRRAATAVRPRTNLL